MARKTTFDPRAISFAEADAWLGSVATLACDIAKLDASHEAQITKIKTAHAAAIKKLKADKAVLDAKLTAFVLTHRDAFTKPRKRQTSHGSYGFQSCNKVKVTDPEKVIQAALDRAYPDLVKTTHKLQRAALKKRLAAGEVIPGATLSIGDTVVVVVDKALISEAKSTTA